MANVLNVLLEITIYSLILYGTILLFKTVFHKHISAIMNYALWGILILRLLLPVTIDSGFSFFVIPKASAQAVQTDNSINGSGLIQGQNTQTDVQYNTQIAEGEPAIEKAAGNVDNIVNDISPQKPAAWDMDWQTVLVLLWAAGILGFLIYMAELWLQLNRNIKRCGIEPPKYILRLVEACKKDLGIKANIRVSVHDWLNTPALCSSLRPKLLIPESMLDKMDMQQLEFGIRHELAHYRHKDHLATLLLTLLRCVYWFNPVVWIASRQIKTDMETACDISVTYRLKNKERMRYIHTMIDLSDDIETQYILGMGLSNERKSLEKRIRGILMKKETSPPVRFMAIIIASIMFIMCFTTACQPTPSTPPVVNKGDNNLEDIIASSSQSSVPSPSTSQTGVQPSEGLSALQFALMQSIGAPEAIKDTYTNEKGDVTVTIDARVEVPAVKSIPAYVVKSPSFSQEFVDKFVSYFFKDTQLVTNERTFTKSQIMGQIVEANATLEDDKKTLQEFKDKGDTLGVAKFEQHVSDDEVYIKSLEKLYETAPEVITRTPATSVLMENKNGNLGLNVAGDLGKDGMATLKVSNSNTGTLSYYNAGNGRYVAVPKPEDLYSSGKTPKGMSLSEEEAEIKAMQCLSDLGIEDMQIGKIYCSWYFSGDFYSAQPVKEDKQCYDFQFIRTINGSPFSNIETSVQLDTDDPNALHPEEPNYAYVLHPESLDVLIDDTGVVGFIWENPTEITSTLSDNVPLLNFDEIVGKAKDFIFYKNYTAYGSTAHITISEIKLNMMRIMRQDKPGEYLIVPVWDFMGNNQSYVTINAIDGSNINRDWGY